RKQVAVVTIFPAAIRNHIEYDSPQLVDGFAEAEVLWRRQPGQNHPHIELAEAFVGDRYLASDRVRLAGQVHREQGTADDLKRQTHHLTCHVDRFVTPGHTAPSIEHA